ncbi:hypothetical protein BACCOP_00244 [Phocaeicola coprocola DSM 17136]|uniref:Uncharacterized protein n=1 Tax=Phocaeicola coprocola DSM 17136 TaxID=470145 RepID=B3JEF3_9BACT|nr:hypothetical protein BACCOP_00244 [Phocaeicola coprocola DSM 17136]
MIRVKKLLQVFSHDLYTYEYIKKNVPPSLISLTERFPYLLL